MQSTTSELACAGDYFLTGPNVNSCPSNYSRIESERDCERAAAAANSPALVKIEDLPTYVKGCQLVSYGNNHSVDKVFVVLNAIVGKPNPFGQLLCAKEKPCAPGKYKLPGTQSSTQPQCADCATGYFQPSPGQPSCLPCKGGFHGIKPGSISDTDGCRPCPPGTYKSNTTGSCSVCAPGTASKGYSMESCDACLGPNSTASCPGGTAVPYTDAQLAVVQKLLPPSPKSTLKCQTEPARFVRTAGTSVVDGADKPTGLLSPTVLGPVAVLNAAAITVLLLHRFIPERLWSNVDFTAQFHKVPQGGASIRENTPLGCAFTFAFGLLSPALGILLHAMNVLVEANSLVPPKDGAVSTDLLIGLDLPAGNPSGNDTRYCAGIAHINNSFEGMTCERDSMSLSNACTTLLTGCRFIDPSAKLTFSVPWSERYVRWSVSADSTTEATAHQLSGVVTSGDAAKLVSPKGVQVAIQAQPAFLNDTTNANLNRHGFLLNHLPCVPAVALNTDLTGPDFSWNFTLELRLSPTLYETVRSLKQGPMELAISIFTTVMAVMGVWKTIFSFVEGPVSALRKRLSRRRHMPRERQPSGVELQLNDRKALLARVISNSKPDDSAAQAAVKEVRKELKAVEDELHEKNKQQDEKSKQQDEKIKQQDEVIRQLTKQQDEKSKQQDEAIRQMTQRVEQMIQQQLKVAV
jgi:hypothetical protein